MDRKDFWEGRTSTHGLVGQMTWLEKKEQAALAMQTRYRMVRERRKFLHHMRRAAAATTLQRSWRRMVRLRKHMAAITLQRKWRAVVERRRKHMAEAILVNEMEREEGEKEARKVAEEEGQKKGEEKPLGERESMRSDTGTEPLAQTFARRERRSYNFKRPSYLSIPSPSWEKARKVIKGIKEFFHRGSSSAGRERAEGGDSRGGPNRELEKNKAAKEVEEKAKRDAEEGGKRREEREDKELAQEEMRAGPLDGRQLKLSPGRHPDKPDK